MTCRNCGANAVHEIEADADSNGVPFSIFTCQGMSVVEFDGDIPRLVPLTAEQIDLTHFGQDNAPKKEPEK